MTDTNLLHSETLIKAEKQDVTLSYHKMDTPAIPDMVDFEFHGRLYAMPNTVLTPATNSTIPETQVVSAVKGAVYSHKTKLAIYVIQTPFNFILISENGLDSKNDLQKAYPPKLVGLLGINTGTLSGVRTYLRHLEGFLKKEFYVLEGKKGDKTITHDHVFPYQIDGTANHILYEFLKVAKA